MANIFYKKLEFDKILKMLSEHAVSEKAAERIMDLEPYMSESETARHLDETTQARRIIELYGTPPLSPMTDLDKILSTLGKGIMLLPEQLGGIALFLTACRRLKSYLKKAEETEAAVAVYGKSIYDLTELEDEINRAIRGNQVDDRASPQLAGIRRKMSSAGEQIKSKLDSLLRNNKAWFSESFLSIRNGHYTLPVKKEYKSQVNGTVIDISQSGSTYFIEPSAARKLQEEMVLLQIEEENEIRRILYTLTALVEANIHFISINREAVETLDFIFSKAKMSLAMNAAPFPVRPERRIWIKGGRHPLLKPETAVPLDFETGGETRGVVITGPNTGGKTVALKTIGLLSLMAQSGLHVPAEDGCFTMNNYVLCDIGDGQSISENLSTFSSHMTNIIEILKTADDQSLVLLDELGSGTDPAEGMGLAVAILEELAAKKCIFVVTTHYPEIKEFAAGTPGMINARMAFDRQTLMPLFRLEIGEAGESCALYIAKRLGLPQHMLKRAAEAAYGERSPRMTAETAFGERSHRLDAESVFEEHMHRLDTALICEEHSHQPAAAAPVPLTADPGPASAKTHAARRIKPQEPKRAPEDPSYMKFNIGDSVIVYPQKLIGIIYQKANEKGELGVQIQKRKLLINHKRIKLHVPASELYPDNYDFSIIFDSVATRKAHRIMERRHDPGLVIELPEVKEDK
jgi:dsDNA-specific endonuclease/ATPase MutS2